LPERLIGLLDGFDDVEVMADPEPDRPPHAWRTHRRCLESIPVGATHLLVLQDDAIPVHSFTQKLSEGIETFPESLLLPFLPGFNLYRVELMRAKQAGRKLTPFLVRSIVPTVAIVYPVDVARGLLAWTEQWPRLRGADDGIVANYCRTFKIQPRAFVPCICDHDHTVMTVGRGNQRRGPHRRAALL
jgi:hypothetical protein